MDYDKSQTFMNSLAYQVPLRMPLAYFILSSEPFRKDSVAYSLLSRVKFYFKT